MRSSEDDLSIWRTARRFKLTSTIAMAAAFSASLDGYRTFLAVCHVRIINMAIGRDQPQWRHRLE